MTLQFVEVHRAGAEVLFEARAADGTCIRLDVFADFAQVQKGSGFVKRLPTEAQARAYAQRAWGSDPDL